MTVIMYQIAWDSVSVSLWYCECDVCVLMFVCRCV